MFLGNLTTGRTTQLRGTHTCRSDSILVWIEVCRDRCRWTWVNLLCVVMHISLWYTRYANSGLLSLLAWHKSIGIRMEPTCRESGSNYDSNERDILLFVKIYTLKANCEIWVKANSESLREDDLFLGNELPKQYTMPLFCTAAKYDV